MRGIRCWRTRGPRSPSGSPRRPRTAARSSSPVARRRATRTRSPPKADADWSSATVWFSDERMVPPDHPDSNFAMASPRAARRGSRARRWWRASSGELGAEAAAGAYEALLRERMGSDPRFDLILLGMGPDAHVASLFPGKPELEEVGRFAAPVPLAGMEPQVPRVTLTYPVLNGAREVDVPRRRRRQGRRGRARVRRAARPRGARLARAPARRVDVRLPRRGRGGEAVVDGQFIGLDVGGTKIASATLENGKLTTRELVKTDVSDSDALVGQLIELIGHLRTDATVAVGVGLPSIIEFETGRIAHSVNIPLARPAAARAAVRQGRDPGLPRERRVVRGARRGVRRERRSRLPEPRDAHRRHRRGRRPRVRRPALPRGDERRRDRPHGDRARPRGRRADARAASTRCPARSSTSRPGARSTGWPSARRARRRTRSSASAWSRTARSPATTSSTARRPATPTRCACSTSSPSGSASASRTRSTSSTRRRSSSAAASRRRATSCSIPPAGSRRPTRCPASGAAHDHPARPPRRAGRRTRRRDGRRPRGRAEVGRMATARELESDYLPIAEHGLVGDLHTVALVGTNGTIDWYCCPAFDAPSVFGSILDKDKGGFYALRPTRRGLGRQAALLPGHERPHHALLHRGRGGGGAGLHADRGRRDLASTATG